MVRNGRAGWYYRVIEQGTIRAGDPIALVDRPNQGFGCDRLIEIVNFQRATVVELQAMATMAGLASRLCEKARQRLHAPD